MTRGAELPPLERLIPHSGAMRLLSRLVEHTTERTVCTVDPADSELFRAADGRVPAWVAVEWMAQCIAAHGTLLDAQDEPRPGFLVGAKRVTLHRDSVGPDESVEVTARVVQRIGRLASITCEVHAGGELAAEGALSVFIPDSVATYPGAGR